MGAIIPQNPQNSIPGVYNFTGANLMKWKAALGDQRAGVSNARIALVGDSTTVGYLANPTPNGFVGARPYGLAAQLVKHLNALGESALADCMANDGNVTLNSCTLPQYDSRVTLGSGWASASGGYGMGGNNIANTTTTNSLSFAPANAFDTIQVIYATLSGGGSFAVNVDGGGAIGSAVSTNGAGGYSMARFSCPLGVHTVNVVPSTLGSGVFIGYINCYNSVLKQIQIFAVAGAGYTAVNYASSGAYSGALSIGSTIAPHLTFINLGINDWVQSEALSTYQSNIQTAITNAQSTGSVILVGPVQSSSSITSFATQQQYRAVLQKLAGSTVPYLDISQLWGGYAAANGVGMMGDSERPSCPGYDDIARMLSYLAVRTI